MHADRAAKRMRILLYIYTLCYISRTLEPANQSKRLVSAFSFLRLPSYGTVTFDKISVDFYRGKNLIETG